MLISSHNYPSVMLWVHEEILPGFLINFCLYPALAFGIRARTTWVSAILPYFLYQNSTVVLPLEYAPSPVNFEGWFRVFEIGGWVTVVLFFLICLNTMFYITGLLQRYIEPRFRAIFRKKHTETGVNGSMIILWIRRKNLQLISWLLPVYSFLIALDLVIMLVGSHNDPISLAWINHHLLASCLIDICLYPALAFAIRARNQWVSAILPYFLYQKFNAVFPLDFSPSRAHFEGWLRILEVGGWVKVILFFLIYMNTIFYLAWLLQKFKRPKNQKDNAEEEIGTPENSG